MHTQRRSDARWAETFSHVRQEAVITGGDITKALKPIRSQSLGRTAKWPWQYGIMDVVHYATVNTNSYVVHETTYRYPFGSYDILETWSCTMFPCKEITT